EGLCAYALSCCPARFSGGRVVRGAGHTGSTHHRHGYSRVLVLDGNLLICPVVRVHVILHPGDKIEDLHTFWTFGPHSALAVPVELAAFGMVHLCTVTQCLLC